MDLVIAVHLREVADISSVSVKDGLYRYGVALMCLYDSVIGEKAVTHGTAPPFPLSAASRQAVYAARLCCVSSRFVLRFLSASSAESSTKRFLPASVPAIGQEQPQEKSQGMKQLMAGAGVAVVGMVLVPLLSSLFTV